MEAEDVGGGEFYWLFFIEKKFLQAEMDELLELEIYEEKEWNRVSNNGKKRNIFLGIRPYWLILISKGFEPSIPIHFWIFVFLNFLNLWFFHLF